MAQNNSTTTDGRSHNQPSHEAQVKGGQNSHGKTQNAQNDNETSSSHSGSGSSQSGGSHNQPSHEASVKGGQHSHSGSSK